MANSASDDPGDALVPPEHAHLRVSDADRERISQILYAAVAEGRLTLPELESRLDAMLAARTVADLVPITSDLPLPSSLGASAAAVPATAHSGADSGYGGSQVSVAVMSLTQRTGDWVLADHHTSIAFWGRTEIDLCSARLVRPESVITAIAIMGAVEIFVPDEVAVWVEGVGVLGRFGGEVARQPDPARQLDPARQPGSVARPVVRVRGLALWGAVLVTRRQPGQPTVSSRDPED